MNKFGQMTATTVTVFLLKLKCCTLGDCCSQC